MKAFDNVCKYIEKPWKEMLEDYVMHPTLLERLKGEFGSENNKKRNWGTLLTLQHFGGKGACWSSRMGTRTNNN